MGVVLLAAASAYGSIFFTATIKPSLVVADMACSSQHSPRQSQQQPLINCSLQVQGNPPLGRPFNQSLIDTTGLAAGQLYREKHPVCSVLEAGEKLALCISNDPRISKKMA